MLASLMTPPEISDPYVYGLNADGCRARGDPVSICALRWHNCALQGRSHLSDQVAVL